MTALTAPQFTDEAAAIAHIEASRWPDGVTCPHCGSVNVRRMEGKTQAGYFLCNDCRDKFTCRTGTVMERSHIPVHKWLLAIHLMSANKNGMSAHQLHRKLGITYKSAWFLAHRIREAMTDKKPAPMGGNGGLGAGRRNLYRQHVEAREGLPQGSQRTSSRSLRLSKPQPARPAPSMSKATHSVGPQNPRTRTSAARRRSLPTKQRSTRWSAREYADHQTVLHAGREYVNKDGFTTNNVENFFGSSSAACAARSFTADGSTCSVT